MKQGLKIYTVDFKGIWPVGNCLIIADYHKYEAMKIAADTITHPSDISVNEMTIEEPQVIEYLSGDY